VAAGEKLYDFPSWATLRGGNPVICWLSRIPEALIQCWHFHQQTPITGATPLIDDSPEVTGAFRGYLLLSVTEAHVGFVYTESA
jgi:hypothetical protein